MTFLHTRDGMALTSTCVLCGMSTRSLSESAIYLSQRGHDAMTCQRRRAEAARAALTEAFLAEHGERSAPIPWALKPPNTHCHAGHEYTPENTRVDGRGQRVCKTCEVLRGRARRERQKEVRESGGLCCGSVELGVAQGRLGSAKTNRPTRERRTVLSTPSATNGKEAVDS